MGKNKGHKSPGNKPKQNTSPSPIVTQFTEKPNEDKISSQSSAGGIGDKKLRYQQERQKKEEEERKRALEEKAKQEAQNNSAKKKSNKKTQTRAHKISEPKPEPNQGTKPKYDPENLVTEPEIQTERNSSGDWNIDESSKEIVTDKSDYPIDNWDDNNSYQEPKGIIINRSFEYDTPTTNNEAESTKGSWGQSSSFNRNADSSCYSDQNETTNSEQGRKRGLEKEKDNSQNPDNWSGRGSDKRDSGSTYYQDKRYNQNREGSYRGNRSSDQNREGSYRGNRSSDQNQEGSYRGNRSSDQNREGSYRGNRSSDQNQEGSYRGNRSSDQNREGSYRGNRSSDQNREGSYRGNRSFYQDRTYDQDRQYGSKSSDSNYRSQQYSNRNSSFDNNSWLRQNAGYPKCDGENDADFQAFLDLARQGSKLRYGKVSETKGDLFTADEDYSLAHCVAEDMAMGAGIAKTFRSKFGQVGVLLNQRQRIGGLAILKATTKYIYYLVTKEQSRGKPTLYTLWMSLQKLKLHVEENNVTKLAIPQIGCGLDRLDWHVVKQMLEHIFKDIDIEILVYIWDETAEEVTHQKLLRKCVVVHSPMKLIDIQKGTGLLYFGSVNGHETKEFESLSTKFNIPGYKAPKTLADVVKTIDRTEYIYGLIIRVLHTDEVDYINIEEALKKLRNMLKKDKTEYLGFQAFIDEKEEYFVDKIIALMQYILVDVEIWVCWPEEIKHLCPQQNKA